MWICRGFSGAVARISTGAWAAAGEVTASSPQHTAPINGDIGTFQNPSNATRGRLDIVHRIASRIRSISKPSFSIASSMIA
jgi:hypothetical protein